MLEACHSGLYYPQDPLLRQEQSQPVSSSSEQLLNLPSALLLPHAAWDYCLGIVHAALATTASLSPSQILLLAPNHSGERNGPLWVPRSDALALGKDSIGFASALRTTLVETGAVIADDGPFTDEPSWELLMPLIEAYHPSVPILPILSSERTADHANHYATLVSNIVATTPDTLIIITANANRPFASPRAEEHARLFVSALQGETEMGARGMSSCNLSALRAVAKIPSFVDQRWKVLDTAVRATVHDVAHYDNHEKHVWQITALLESR